MTARLAVQQHTCVNDLLMQFQADLLGIPVVRPEVTETTALGVAYLAGLQAGVFRSLDDLRERWEIERTFYPSLGREHAQEKMSLWEKAVRQTTAE